MPTTTNHDPVARALLWLKEAQIETGEVPAWATPLEDAEPLWSEDSLNFITALAATSLANIERQDAVRLVDSAIEFLEQEQQPNGLWRYWATANEQTSFTPADADDTACCSMALGTRDRNTVANIPLLLSNRSSEGRFYTWFVPRNGLRGLRLRQALREERQKDVRELRASLWETTEAEPDDIDVVVNANVCRYLGSEAPYSASGWVASELRGGREVGSDKWHRIATTFYLSIADGAHRGVKAFEDLDGLIVDNISKAWSDGKLSTDLDKAQSLLALQRLDAQGDTSSEIASALEQAQSPAGSWERTIYYFGGPKEVFGWASEALTTSYAAEALCFERYR